MLVQSDEYQFSPHLQYHTFAFKEYMVTVTNYNEDLIHIYSRIIPVNVR